MINYVFIYIYISMYIHLDPLLGFSKFWSPNRFVSQKDPGRIHDLRFTSPMEGYDKESLLGRGACAAGRAQSHGEPCKSPKKGCWCERSTKISARCSGFSKKNKYIVYHCFC